jgi:hypothetical protein
MSAAAALLAIACADSHTDVLAASPRTGLHLDEFG